MDSRQRFVNSPSAAKKQAMNFHRAWHRGDTNVRAPGGNAGEHQKASISGQRLETRYGQEANFTQFTRVTGVMIP
jgi:hypothetical protein